jgi:hypothetical protein
LGEQVESWPESGRSGKEDETGKCGLDGRALSSRNTAHLVLTRRTTTAVGERHTVGRLETSEPVSLHHALEAFTDAARVSGLARNNRLIRRCDVAPYGADTMLSLEIVGIGNKVWVSPHRTHGGARGLQKAEQKAERYAAHHMPRRAAPTSSPSHRRIGRVRSAPRPTPSRRATPRHS